MSSVVSSDQYLSLQGRINHLQNMVMLLLSAISQKSTEIDLWLEVDQDCLVKLERVYSKMTIKELYEKCIPREFRKKFLVFGDKVIDPFMMRWPDGNLRTVESALKFSNDPVVGVYDGKFIVSYHSEGLISGEAVLNINSDSSFEEMAKEMEDQISRIHFSELRLLNGAFLKIRSFCSRNQDIAPDTVFPRIHRHCRVIQISRRSSSYYKKWTCRIIKRIGLQSCANFFFAILIRSTCRVILISRRFYTYLLRNVEL
jgi:hypothetical protein